MTFERTTQQQRMCITCQHPLPHKWDVMGKSMCSLCPDGKCTPIEAQTPELQVTVAGMGMDVLSTMTNQQLIEEIVLAQRTAMRKMERTSLIRTVMQFRLEAVRERLWNESGLEPGSDSIFGNWSG